MSTVQVKRRRDSKRVYVTLKDASGRAKRTRSLTVYGMSIAEVESTFEQMANHPQPSFEDHGPSTGRNVQPLNGGNELAAQSLAGDGATSPRTLDGAQPSQHDAGANDHGSNPTTGKGPH